MATNSPKFATVERYIPGKIPTPGSKPDATKSKAKPKIVSCVKVSIPIERIWESKRSIEVAKKSLVAIEKRINDIDIELHINKTMAGNLKINMEEIEPKINACQEIQAKITKGPVEATKAQTVEMDWDLDDVLELTDETVRSWMPTVG